MSGKPKKSDEGGASKGVFSCLGLPGKRPGSQVLLSEAEDGRTEAKVERRAPPPVYENPFDASRPPPLVYEDTFSDAGDGGGSVNLRTRPSFHVSVLDMNNKKFTKI